MGLNPLQQTLTACALGVTLGALAQARSMAPLLDRIRPPPDDAPLDSPDGPLAAVARAPGTAPIPPLRPLPPRGASSAPMPAVPIEEPCLVHGPSGCQRGALASFDEAVNRADRHGRPLRVSHLGDSVVAVDKLTRRLRASLQARFGDGGPGWIFVSQPSRWYHPQGVEVTARGWRMAAVVSNGAVNGDYGLAGAVFEPEGNVTETRLQTTLGNVAQVEVHFVGQPQGDALSITLDANPGETLSTANATTAWSRWSRTVPDGNHLVTLRTLGPRVRLAGLVMERTHGAVVDNLGLVGNSSRALQRNFEAPWQQALALRAPDLVLITLGANEVSHGHLGPPQRQRFAQAYRDVFRRIRGTRPSPACLVTSVLDAAEPVNGQLATRTSIPAFVQLQRAEALAAGCAFWDVYAWMGGSGSALRWRRFGWMEPDYTHPTGAGGARVADALLAALFATRRPVTPPAPPTP